MNGQPVHQLQFASRAKSIQNKPVKNAIVTDKALLKKYETEVEDLKRQIEFVGRQTCKTLTALNTFR
jgi:hypothetical protein